MNVYITISNVGADAGPFNLYSDVDGYISAFETNIPKAILEAGYSTNLVPEGTLEIRIQSVNELCNNYVNVGTIPLEYYFEPNPGAYVIDFLDNGTFAYVYGYFSGYFNGSYTVPGNLLVKLNINTSVDTSFDIGEGFNLGIVYTGATLFQQTDGKLILSGFYTSFNGVSANRIIRLNTDGSRDNTFNVGTGFNNYTTKIAVEPTTNKMYITGLYSTYNGISSPRLVRLLSDGSYDSSFVVGSGFNNTSIDVIVNTDGTIYVTGYFTVYNGVGAPKIIKLNPDGTKDTSFNPGTGFNVGNLPVALARISGEDNFFCAGYFTTYNGIPAPQIVKLDSTGAIVPTSEFDPGTGFNGDIGTIKIIWNDKIYLTPGDGGGGEFTSYNGTSTFGSPIILNKDGTILQAWSVGYANVYIIGNNVYGSPIAGGANQLIYVYDPLVTTTTTTTI